MVEEEFEEFEEELDDGLEEAPPVIKKPIPQPVRKPIPQPIRKPVAKPIAKPQPVRDRVVPGDKITFEKPEVETYEPEDKTYPEMKEQPQMVAVPRVVSMEMMLNEIYDGQQEIKQALLSVIAGLEKLK
jgi:ASC-1-like (ASCH) protein